ncbi:hypothetical protein EDB84DRAFT_1266450, partial [Lactarius hengduanensis]
VLAVVAQINLPEVRWRAANGMAEMSQKVCRHLVEQRWRNEGASDLLMEHFHQMRVSPDALPVLQPTVDLRVILPEAPPKDVALRAREKRKTVPVEAGALFTRCLPMLYATAFHPEPRFYTLLIQVTPSLNVPDNQSFRMYLYWPNISLSATFTGLLLSISRTPYVPLHPTWGMPCHRNVLLLLPTRTRLRT